MLWLRKRNSWLKKQKVHACFIQMLLFKYKICSQFHRFYLGVNFFFSVIVLAGSGYPFLFIPNSYVQIPIEKSQLSLILASVYTYSLAVVHSIHLFCIFSPSFVRSARDFAFDTFELRFVFEVDFSFKSRLDILVN